MSTSTTTARIDKAGARLTLPVAALAFAYVLTQRRRQRYAVRFAAKEAVAKALGAPAGMNWQDCWVGLNANGSPFVQVSGTVLAAADARGVHRWHLSLSHDGDVATAMVVAEGEDPGVTR